jgi:hypothetical protein
MALDAFFLNEYDDDCIASDRARSDLPWRKGNRRRDEQPRRAQAQERQREQPPARRGPTRAARQGREEFRCRHCRALIGPTVLGGKHRNHCPLCLHSRHVDDRRPGDRASTCGAQMAPVGRFDRPGGEPVLIHRCLGCGQERHNRIAADDNIPLLTRLPLLQPRFGRYGEQASGETGAREQEAS